MKVLVVEDEVLVCVYLRKLLERNGYIVDVSSDGLDGLNKAQTLEYDIIILDVILPKCNGLKICKEIRASGVSVPVIFLSSCESEAEKIAGLDAGGDDYIVKPFGGEELCARIRAVKRRPSSTVDTKLKCGKLMLDPSRREVRINQRQVSLRNKEFELLYHLMQKQGQAVSRDKLLNSVWGVRSTNSSNRLEVSVRHLRSKLEDIDRDKSYVHTIRGMGYMVDKEPAYVGF